MLKAPTPSTKHTPAALLGYVLVAVSLLVLLGFGLYLASRGDIFSADSADAILYIDVPGRIAIDRTLQIEGPAPVPVAVGIHTLTFFDVAVSQPVEVSVHEGEFGYVPNPALSRSYYGQSNRGVVHIAAFPPDTTVEIPDCTPIDVKHPVTCKSSHTLSADLSPGTYTVIYTNPHLGRHEQQFTIGADAVVRQHHSFIATVAEWDEWRAQHGEVIERRSSYYRGHGAGDAFLLPLEATGALVGELFN